MPRNGAGPSSTASLDRAHQLAQTHEHPMLALKAYGLWMRSAAASPSARVFGLLDLTLYCNMFAIEGKSASDVDLGLRRARARDYFQLVLDQFEGMYCLEMPSFTTATEAYHTEEFRVALPTKRVPEGLLAALQVTLHNWACLEAHEDAEGLKLARKLLAASRSIEGQMIGNSLLGWSWDWVTNITSAEHAVMQCDFATAEEAARKAVELVRTNAKGPQGPSVTSSSGRAISDVGDAELLQALSYYALGLAIESTACEESLACYEEALMHATKNTSAYLYRSVMEHTRGQLAAYIEEEHHRERIRVTAVEAANAGHADRKGQSAGRARKTQGATRRAARKASNSRTSVSAQNLTPVVAPPIPEPLQLYLSEHGLSTLVTSVCNFKTAFNALVHSLPGLTGRDEPLPTSLFAGTRFEASEAQAVFVVLVCTSTPLQWTLRLREAANQPPAAVHRSVWSPRPTLAPLLTELAAERPPGPKSTSAYQTRKEIAEGNSRLRQQVLQLFAPPTAAARVKQSAHESVDTVVQLLLQRLGVLLKTEKAFEDHWTATERVFSALQSYSVSQDLVRLKTTLVSQQRLRHMRRERSVRTIVHFFRDIVGQRARRAEQSMADHHRLAEREQATLVLQKYVRRWLAYQEARRRANEYAKYVEKVVVVQSLARRKFAEAGYKNLRRARELEERLEVEQTHQAYAALQIQRVYRGHCSRLRCYHLRGLAHEAMLHHLCNSRNYYATLIQKRVRGMLVRRQHSKAVRAKRCYGRNVYRRQLWERSCVTIQRAYRAYRLRRATAANSTLDTERNCLQSSGVPQLFLTSGDEAASFPESAEANAAAQRIQDAYRSCVARRRLEALKYGRMKSTSPKDESGWSRPTPFSLKECVF